MIPVGWLQLKKDRQRFAVALAGVAFAVMLVFMQFGFRAALFKSAVKIHERLICDLVMISPKTPSFIYPKPFSRRRLAQAKGMGRVASTGAIYVGFTNWKNPADPRKRRLIAVIGFDPTDPTIAMPEVQRHRHRLMLPDVALFDEFSRPEFGPIPELVERHGEVPVEIRDRRVNIVGVFGLGTSFGIDGTVITSDLNFQRIFRSDANHIHLGLIRLQEGAVPEEERDRIAAHLLGDAEVLTREQYIERELAYWNHATPVGFIFALGSVIGLIVGAIIVYQILHADVTDHLREYATLKAMGYSDGRLSMFVVQQGVILALIGFVPGLLVSLLLYRSASTATQLPLQMTAARVAGVLALTVAMCVVSGSLALRKVRSADPADVF